MANSYVLYSGDTVADSFAVSFDYLSTTHISVRVDDVLKTSGTHYNITGGNVVFTVGNIPGSGSNNIKIQRDTPRTKATRVVDFEDGSVLTESDLDNAHLQLLYIAQEAFERDGDTISDDVTYLAQDSSDGTWDASSKRIKSVATPTGSNDAVNKTFMETRSVARSADDGDYDASSKKITNVADPSAAQDAMTKAYADATYTTTTETHLPLDTSDNKWNALYSAAKRAIKNVLDDSDLTSVPTKDYVDSLALYGIAGDPTYITTALVDADDTYTLTGFGSNTNVKPEMLVVSIDGVHQAPGADYTILSTDDGGDAQIKLTSAPTATEAGLTMIVMNFGTGRVASTDTLADGAVTTVKLADSAVTSAKIADDAVTADQIATDAVTSDGIAADAVTASEIAAGAVGTSEIATDAVTSSEIAADAVGASEIAAGAVGASEIATGAVGSSEIATGAVGASEIADGSVTFSELNSTGSGTTFHTGSGLSGTAPHILKVSSAGVLTLAPLAGSEITDLGAAVGGLAISDFGAATSEVNMGNQFVTNVKTPTSAAHAASKSYVDDVVSGMRVTNNAADSFSDVEVPALTTAGWGAEKLLATQTVPWDTDPDWDNTSSRLLGIHWEIDLTSIAENLSEDDSGGIGCWLFTYLKFYNQSGALIDNRTYNSLPSAGFGGTSATADLPFDEAAPLASVLDGVLTTYGAPGSSDPLWLKKIPTSAPSDYLKTVKVYARLSTADSGAEGNEEITISGSANIQFTYKI